MLISTHSVRQQTLLAVLWATVAAAQTVLGGSEASSTTAPDEMGYRWFSLPIAVSGLPPGGVSVPVTAAINFTDLIERAGSEGTVDERSIRLYRRAAGQRALPAPVQFNAAAQPRFPERRLLPGTTGKVSYLGEYNAGEKPGSLQVVGELTWLADVDATGRAEYRLDFGCLQAGRAVQVPYAPQNLRMFDAQGRATPAHAFPAMQIRPQWPLDGKVNILDQNQLVTTYHLGPMIVGTSIRRPFLYPVNGPDGISLTEFGKPHDPTGSHAHHYSLWIAHADIGGSDFWSEKGGIIAHAELEEIEDGPVYCRLSHRTQWKDAGRTMLLERRRWTFYTEHPHPASGHPFPSGGKESDALDGTRLIDVELEFSAPGAEPVGLGKTSFGFLAARVAQSMTVFDGGGEIVNANGDLNEQGALLKRAAWIDQSGPVTRERWNGIAIMDHPDNPNHPTAWHCRNDGWVGAAFNSENAFTLEPGKTLRLRYRIVLHRDNAVESQIAQRYREYSATPVCALGAPTRHSTEP